MAEKSDESQILLVFDFDHTLIEDNADLSVSSLAPDGIPDEIKSLYDKKGLINYMRAIFQHLHKRGIMAEDIQKCVESLPFTSGMQELFDYIQQVDCQYDTIIISDANCALIEYFLNYHSLTSVVSHVFSNPAEFDSHGCLVVDKYHSQDWCKLSTANLCKGYVLQDYIQRQRQKGVHYSHVVYIGDGANDLCPGLTLRTEDYLMARKGFTLWNKLEKLKQKPSSKKKVAASVIGWDSGVEIKAFLEEITGKREC